MVVALCVEAVGMQHLQSYIAAVQNVQAGKDSSDLLHSVASIEHLALERIFVVLVEREVASKTIPHERVLVGEHYFYKIFAAEQPLLLDQYLMVPVNELLLWDSLVVH